MSPIREVVSGKQGAEEFPCGVSAASRKPPGLPEPAMSLAVEGVVSLISTAITPVGRSPTICNCSNTSCKSSRAPTGLAYFAATNQRWAGHVITSQQENSGTSCAHKVRCTRS